MKLLVHLCCSNCALYPLQDLLVRGHTVRGFWFNPNIHPYTEYRSRLDSVERLAGLWSLDVEYQDEYALEPFLRAVLGHEGQRCEVCYRIRLDRAAETAKRMSFDGFTTSLLGSPYQKFDMINVIGNEAARRHGTVFYAADYRTGWNASRGLSRELGLYRQRYCGCIFSEMERSIEKEEQRKQRRCR